MSAPSSLLPGQPRIGGDSGTQWSNLKALSLLLDPQYSDAAARRKALNHSSGIVGVVINGVVATMRWDKIIAAKITLRGW
jgi:hypothetical protein